MTIMPAPEAFADCRGRERGAVKLPPSVDSKWTDLRSLWRQWLARRRLRQSIAHLDDRLLADIGLGAEDLGNVERFTRRRAANIAANIQDYWSIEASTW